MVNEEITGFSLYKGLKKPLMFKGLKGKYIYQAGGAFVGTLVLAIIMSNILGFFIGLVVAIVIGGALIWKVLRNQKVKGLHNKTLNNNQIHIMPKRIKLKQRYEKQPI